MIPRSRTTRTGGSRTERFLACVLFLLMSLTVPYKDSYKAPCSLFLAV